MVRMILAFVIAMVAAAIVGSIIQTQFNLAALAELSVPISFDTRISTIIHDLLHFSPMFAVIVAAVMMIALPVAYALARWQQHRERWWFTLAGFIGLLVGFWVVNNLAPMPTLIAATRTWTGLLSMALTGGFAGWLFDRLWRPTPQELAEPVL
ncbi:hypothetical protein ACFOD1_12585 [Pseudidiomarina halophila]|uniref:Uncharacterized protein n=1 Tax=Pseudidiomarina halophila TaxID=1449799 RepID=A0A432XVA5_9GAMM|nr:hypothetical protein [Pseudidiomarina halophila]RUO52652.1 hypothetical protein CWI69_06335 [Pseudidiomarina halophila]